jgi:hypothetical protein
MMKNLIKLLAIWCLPFVILLMVLFISSFLPGQGYINTTAGYILLNYYIFILIKLSGGEKKRKNSVYEWLDILDGESEILKVFKKEKKYKDITKNLEFVFKYFNSHYDIIKLKLLRGYFKTLNDEGPHDMLFKTLLGVLAAIVIWGINRGFVLEIVKPSRNTSFVEVSPVYFTILNFVTIIFEGILIFAIIIKDYFKNKKRNRIIIEILEVCIENEKNK